MKDAAQKSKETDVHQTFINRASGILPTSRMGKTLAAFFVLLTMLAAMVGFQTQNTRAWFGTGSCPFDSFAPGHKCLALDAGGVELPYRGEIILPSDATSITDAMFFNGTHPMTGSYRLDLLEDEGGNLHVYQTMYYTVNADGSTTPASTAISKAAHDVAFTQHAVGTGGLLGYLLYINGAPVVTNQDTCQNHISFIGASTTSATSGTAPCNPPSTFTPIAPPPPPPSPSSCLGTAGQTIENNLTAQSPAQGGTVHAGDAIGAAFHDETPMATVAPYALLFTLAGPGGTSDLVANHTATTTNLPEGTDFPGTYDSTQAHNGVAPFKEYLHVVGISATLPSSLTPGNYTAHLKAFDTDQNKPGGDCGEATWSFTVTAPPPPPPANGTIAGHIVACGSTTDVGADLGGKIAIAGPDTKVGAPNPVSYTVQPGAYSMTAIAPSGYHFQNCADTAVIDSPTTAHFGDINLAPAGSETRTFHVSIDTGTISGHIYDCSTGTANKTNDIAGGNIAVAGPSDQAAAHNPVAYTGEMPGAYTLTAVAPNNYHFVQCGSALVSPFNATGFTLAPAGTQNADFFVAHDLGKLGGNIILCADSTPVLGGTIGLTGPTSIAPAATPLTPAELLAGDQYTLSAVAPSGYHFVDCGKNGVTIVTPTSATRQATVVVDKTKTPVFYVTADAPAPCTVNCGTGGGTGGTGGGTPGTGGGTKPVGSVLGASISQPNTGQAEVFWGMLIGLVMVVSGGAVALSTRQARY